MKTGWINIPASTATRITVATAVAHFFLRPSEYESLFLVPCRREDDEPRTSGRCPIPQFS